MVNLPVAIALIVVLPLAILLAAVVMIVNAIRRRPVHGLASAIVILACLGGTVYGTVCIVMHMVAFVEEKAPGFPEAVKSAADTGAVVLKEGVRAGSTAVVDGATEAVDQIKDKWSEADLATARSLKIKFVRVLSAEAEGGGQTQAVTVIAVVDNPTSKTIDFGRLVGAGLVLGVDDEGLAYPATGLASKNTDLAPATKTRRVLTFEVEPKVKLVDVRMAGGAEAKSEKPLP